MRVAGDGANLAQVVAVEEAQDAGDLLHVGAEVVDEGAGRVALDVVAEVQRDTGADDLLQPRAIGTIEIGDGIAVGGDGGRAVVAVLGDGAIEA